MKASLLPPHTVADGTEGIVIVSGPADDRRTGLMPAGLLADAATKPTPDELKAAVLAALVQGSNITFVQNADGTVSVAVSDSADLPGTPKAPTADPGTNTRQIATTAFVDAVRAALTTAINSKQGALVPGANIDLHANGDGTFTIASTAAGGGALTDGVYGDVTVSGGGTVLTVTKVTNGTVTVPDEAYGAAWQTKLSVPTKNAVYNQIEAVKSSKVSTTAVGAANGVASLDATGKVPAGQLPSYVDDVLEFSNSGAFPNPGETGKIYVALDTNAQWRWSGTAYVQLIASPGTTDNVVEGSTNKYYTDVRVRAAVMTGLVSTAGTPVGTDSLLTVLGKLYRQAFTQVLPLAGGTMTGNFVAANNVRVCMTDTGGTSPNFICQNDNNVCFYTTDASGALRPVWSIFARSNTASFGFAVPITVNGSSAVQGSSAVDGAGGTQRARYWFTSGAYAADISLLADNNTMAGNCNGAWSWRCQGAEQLRVEINKGIQVTCFDSTYNVGVKQTRTGQVGYHMYNGGAVCEWLTYQPNHAAGGDDYRIATYVGGATTDRFKIGADGTTYAMANFYVNNEIWAMGQIIRFGGAGANHYVWFDNTNYQMPNGGLVVGGNISSSSDRRLKSDIRPLTGAREILAAIGSYRFTMSDAPHVGVIAQEVEEVLPELVTADTAGILSVDYGKLAAVLIADNNAMAARIEALEAMVAKLAA